MVLGKIRKEGVGVDGGWGRVQGVGQSGSGDSLD
jgi:hypothetical protein